MLTNAAGESVVLEPHAWDGENRSGFHPLDDKVLVLPHRVLGRTRGGIELPDASHEKEQDRIQFGILVERGGAAFQLSGDRVRVWADDPTNPKPVPGDHVYFERYSGFLVTGDDGLTYRLLDDKCIGARLKAPASTES